MCSESSYSNDRLRRLSFSQSESDTIFSQTTNGILKKVECQFSTIWYNCNELKKVVTLLKAETNLNDRLTKVRIQRNVTEQDWMTLCREVILDTFYSDKLSYSDSKLAYDNLHQAAFQYRFFAAPVHIQTIISQYFCDEHTPKITQVVDEISKLVKFIKKFKASNKPLENILAWDMDTVASRIKEVEGIVLQSKEQYKEQFLRAFFKKRDQPGLMQVLSLFSFGTYETYVLYDDIVKVAETYQQIGLNVNEMDFYLFMCVNFDMRPILRKALLKNQMSVVRLLIDVHTHGNFRTPKNWESIFTNIANTEQQMFLIKRGYKLRNDAAQMQLTEGNLQAPTIDRECLAKQIERAFTQNSFNDLFFWMSEYSALYSIKREWLVKIFIQYPTKVDLFFDMGIITTGHITSEIVLEYIMKRDLHMLSLLLKQPIPLDLRVIATAEVTFHTLDLLKATKESHLGKINALLRLGVRPSKECIDVAICQKNYGAIDLLLNKAPIEVITEVQWHECTDEKVLKIYCDREESRGENTESSCQYGNIYIYRAADPEKSQEKVDEPYSSLYLENGDIEDPTFEDKDFPVFADYDEDNESLSEGEQLS